MAEKYYAVKSGRKTGIFRSWDECKESIGGYSGAIYKSFKTNEEALAYMGGGLAGTGNEQNRNMAQDGNVCPAGSGINSNCVKIYVDGSYNSITEEFSYGMVVLLDEMEEKHNRKFDDKELAAMRNVAGEIKGAEAAMQYAMDHGIAEIAIYHDYEGIARWCLGEWKTNKEGTRAYKEFYDMASKRVNINFVKVAGHSNDLYNDMADELAKEALGLL